MAKTKAKRFRIEAGYYDPADYVLVHKDYLAKLRRQAKEEPPSPDAVDPVGGPGTEGPRATEGI